MNDVLFSSGIYGFIHSGEQSLGICFLSVFGEICQLAHHGFHVRFKRKTTLPAYFSLLGPFDGGLNKWHKAAKWYASDSLRSRKEKKKEKGNPHVMTLTEFQLYA